MWETDNFEAEIRKDEPRKPRKSRGRMLCPACSKPLRKPIEPYRAMSGRTIKFDGDKRCLFCNQLIDWT